jgi:hypothetical protein
VIIAVDADSRDTAEAEHLLHELLGPAAADVVACTHVVTGDHPHVAISVVSTTDAAGQLAERARAWSEERSIGSAITWPGASGPELSGPSSLVRGAYLAAIESALGSTGRMVRFPGAQQASGVMTVLELRERCGIDQVEALGGLPVEDDTLVDTRDFIRPIRREGRVVLLVQPAVGGVLIPFEVEHQQKCCADH